MPPDENIIDFRLTGIEAALARMSASMEKLVVLEQKHSETREALTRAFAAIESQEARLRVLETDQQVLGASSHCRSHSERLTAIENEMPTLKLVRKWVISGVVGSIGLLIVAVAVLVKLLIMAH